MNPDDRNTKIKMNLQILSREPSFCSTTQYIKSHGKNPRGYGKWAFGNLDEIMFITGKYAEVKKQASKHFKGWFQVLP